MHQLPPIGQALNESDLDRIIGMAWEDRIPFEAIKAQFGVSEKEVIEIMRRGMKPSSFRMWRERVQGRATKHLAKRNFAESRYKCDRQRVIGS
ncbi:MAG TPA: TIGR03643 family protein [Polyangiaceae bacterium]|nr:TIGR03643 family protein [Polyangiaceae bacterium]